MLPRERAKEVLPVNDFVSALSVLGVRGLLPLVYGLTVALILTAGYGQGPGVSFRTSLLAAAFVLLDAGLVEATFRDSRKQTGMSPTNGDTAAMLVRLAVKYYLIVVVAMLSFEIGLAGGLSAAAAFVLAAAVAATVYVLFTALHNESVHVRGTEPISMTRAQLRAFASGGLFGEWFRFVPGLWLPVRALKLGVLIVGGSQTGKTLLLRLLLQWILSGRRYYFGIPLPGRRRKVRLFVFDGKADLLPVIAATAAGTPIYVMNPFDSHTPSDEKRRIYRSTRWAIAKDTATPAQAKTVARVFVPDDPSIQRDPFWVLATIMIISGVFIALHQKKPGAWSLADVVRVFGSEADLRALLASCRFTKNRLFYLEQAKNSSADILKTICNYILSLEEVAAVWEHSTHETSLVEWAAGDGVILCPVDATLKEPLDALYRAFFKRMVQVLLRPNAEREERTFVILDEATHAGELPFLNTLLTMGFGKGAYCFLAFQSREGFASVLTRERASEAMGQTRNRIYTQMNEDATNKAVSEEIGKHEFWKTTPAHGAQPEKKETAERSAVSPEDLMHLRAASREGGMTAYVTSPLIAAVTKLDLTGKELKRLVSPEDSTVPAAREAPPKHQYLEPWGSDERRALGLPEVQPEPVPKPASAPKPQPETAPEPPPNKPPRPRGRRRRRAEGTLFDDPPEEEHSH
jgi:hypothetical protein